MSHASQMLSISRIALAVTATVLFAGCAGPVTRWIVDTRVHQGDVALDRGNVKDADLSYRLALRIDPNDPRARSGIVQSSADLAQEQYTKGDFEDALATINE